MKTVEVPLKKTKIFLLLLAGIVFVVIGTFFMIYPDKLSTISPFVRSPALIFIVGLASVLFSGLGVFYVVKKLFDKKMGFVISEEGIIDNSAGIVMGMIFWKDIKQIETYKYLDQKLIRIIVKNPNDYIERQTSYFKRKLFAINQKHYGSPIQISANSLDIKNDELYELLQSKFSEYKSPHLAQV